MIRKALTIFLIAMVFVFQSPFVFAVKPEDPGNSNKKDETTTVEEPPVVEELPAEKVTPVDDVAPEIISLEAISTEPNEASIVWTTDEVANGRVEYGETVDYGQSSDTTSFGLEHDVMVTGLVGGNTYHFRIVVQDETGNESTSADKTFETPEEFFETDNLPPEILEVNVMVIDKKSATISWTTDELAQGRVEYGLTENLKSSAEASTEFAVDHSVTLTNLASGKTYFYRIVVIDEANNELVTPIEEFTLESASTPSNGNENAGSSGGDGGSSSADPVISGVTTSAVGKTTATIIWNTDIPTTSQVFYSQTPSYEFSSELISDKTTTHSVTLTELTPGTNYFYKVVSEKNQAHVASKEDLEFTTLYREVVLDPPPTISDLKVETVTIDSATITWTTDMPASGEVRYGTTTGYEETDGGHKNFLTKHVHKLTGLKSATVYNFQAVAWNESGDEALYKNETFKTKDQTNNTGGGGGGSSGGGGGVSTSSSGSVKYTSSEVFNTSSLDAEVLFLWQKVESSTALETVIVRGEDVYPKTPDDGLVVYKGTSGRFADVGLEEGKTYLYSIFRVDEFGHYSEPKLIRVKPKTGVKQTTLQVVPPVVQKTPVFVFRDTLEPGEKNHQVAHLQVLLASKPDIYPQGLITSYYGPLTTQALTRFQKKYHLPVTGLADRQTLDKLQEFSKIEHITDFSKLYDFWFRDLQIGLSGKDVRLLQAYLAKLGYYETDKITGNFGTLTKSAVIEFQKSQDIEPPAGYFGPKTQRRLSNILKLEHARF